MQQAIINPLRERITLTLFTLLFAWIAFFPEPLQGQLWFWAAIFSVPFLLNLFFDNRGLFQLSDWPLWLFLILLASGNINATDKETAWRTYKYLVLTFLLIFYIGKGIFMNERARKQAVFVICILSGIVVFIGLLELYFAKNILYEKFIANPFYERYSGPYLRLMSTQLNPAVLGSFLIGCLPFNFYLFSAKSRYFRLPGIVLSLLCVAVIVFTFSRGVFLGLIALTIFFLGLVHRRKALVAFLILLALFIAFCTQQKDTKLARFGAKNMIWGGYDSVFSEYRLNRIKMSTRIFRDHPFFGIGLNHFRIRFADYCDKGEIEEIDEFRIPDNMYLTFLTETGLIGAFGFFVFIFSLVENGLRKLKLLADENTRMMLLVSMTALTGLLVNMGAYELFYWNNPYVLFCLVCGFSQGLISLRQGP